MLGWLERQFDDELKRTIATWPDTLQLRFHDAPSIRLVHGSAHSAGESIYPCTPDEEIEEAMAGTSEHVVVAGHTHLPMQRTVGKWQILNPGSVGVPIDGRFSASYMLLESTGGGWRPTFRRVPFDLSPVLREFEHQGFVEECGVIGCLVVETFRTARPHITPFLRWRAETYPGEPLSSEMLDDYLLSATWEQYVEPAYLMASGECDRVANLEYNRS
jgi:diadenosine tetraphosphatase ApaH/serine/threonine PP2A family protein phosphatase